MVSSKPLKIPLFRLASGRTQVDERLGISLQKLAQRVPFRHIPHRHDFYHVAWIEAGTGIFIQDDKSYPIKAGSLIFIPPGQAQPGRKVSKVREKVPHNPVSLRSDDARD
ncbi:MAG: AraC family ligand binding domain-containing protein [Verrucomicrobia bacterium]|nr:AraC family ligand binding domain-containing protein [Verrucomicrobiota bacterium]MBV8279333.1 AraC family ligand binding domain-containing protein [Verrucomicrobiota bacterium]